MCSEGGTRDKTTVRGQNTTRGLGKGRETMRRQSEQEIDIEYG